MEAIRQKIIIDTDIGDDIDDAFALALAVHSPELELIGVTTVFRNSEIRAKMAKALLASYGRMDIPVCAGMDIPLLQASHANMTAILWGILNRKKNGGRISLSAVFLKIPVR